jgi:hypothetical protein
MASVTASGALAPLSVPYASPEQAAGERQLTGASDQYSLACAAFEALTATVPFRDREPADVLRAHTRARAPSVNAFRPGLPGGVDWVFARALAKRPGERFRSCGEFASALTTALGVRSGANTAAASNDRTAVLADTSQAGGAWRAAATRLAVTGRTTPAPPRRRRGRAVAIGALGLACAIGALLVVLVSATSQPHRATPEQPAAATAPITTRAPAPGSKDPKPSASTPSTTSPTDGSGTADAGTRVLAQANLAAPSTRPNSRALGVVLVERRKGSEDIVATAQGLRKPASGGYGIWLSGPAGDTWLGFFASRDSNGRLLARGPFNGSIKRGTDVLITRETAGDPAQPGPVFLRGPLIQGDV